MKPQTRMWIGIAVAGVVVGWVLSSSASSNTIAVAPGAIALPVPSNGLATNFQLPAGATWVSASVVRVAGAAPVSLALPTGSVLTGPVPNRGMILAFQWTDASGTMQTMVVTYS